MDDGSKDFSEKICDEYKLRDKRITFIHLANYYVAMDVHFGDVQIYDVSSEKFLSLVKIRPYGQFSGLCFFAHISKGIFRLFSSGT